MGGVRGGVRECGTVRKRENGCVRGTRSVDNMAADASRKFGDMT